MLGFAQAARAHDVRHISITHELLRDDTDGTDPQPILKVRLSCVAQ